MVYKCLDKKSERIETKTASEIHNKSIRSWLKTNNTDIYLTNNDKNLVVTEQFIRTLKNKTYK